MTAEEDRYIAAGSAFAVTRRGYDPVQVDNYLQHVDAQLRMLAADRDAAVEQTGQLTQQINVTWAEMDRLRGQLRRLSAPPQSVEGMSERLQSMLKLAQDEVAETHAKARAEADRIVAAAEDAAADIPKRLEQAWSDIDTTRVELARERERIIGEADKEADRIRRQAAEEIELRIAEAAATRAQVEEDFEIAMTARRSEAMTVIHENTTTSRDEARRRLTDATREAQRRMTEADETARETVRAAQRRVAELDELRDFTARQLTGLHQLLGQQLTVLGAPEGAGDESSPSQNGTDGHSVRAEPPRPRPRPAPEGTDVQLRA